MEWVAECLNTVLSEGIGVPADHEQRLILDLFAHLMAMWQFCKGHNLSHKAFAQIQNEALVHLNHWLTEHNVRAIDRIV